MGQLCDLLKADLPKFEKLMEIITAEQKKAKPLLYEDMEKNHTAIILHTFTYMQEITESGHLDELIANL